MAKNSLKEPVSTITAVIMIIMALVAGFLGGIVFSDHAYKKYGLKGQMMPGQVAQDAMGQGQLPEGHPAIDPNSSMGQMGQADQGQLPEGHPAIGAGNNGMGQGTSPDTQKSIDMMEKMLSQNSNDTALLVHLGNLYFDSGESQKAIDKYEKALKIRPNMPDVLTDCGVMYRAVGKYDKAIEYFKKSQSYDPKHAQSYFNMGVVYRNDLHDTAKAIAAWTKFLELDPNNQNANGIREQLTEMQTELKSGKKVMGGNSSNILDQKNESGHADMALVRGEQLYKQKGCGICHLLNGTGGKMGPALDHVGSKRNASYIKKILVNPKSVAPKTNMPPVNLPDADVEALTKYLTSLK